MDANVKACIITAHNSKGWYPRGQQRLVNSLYHHGTGVDILAYSLWETSTGGWDGTLEINGRPAGKVRSNRYKSDCPYTLKAVAWEHAAKLLGYDVILWLDCSVWAIKPIMPVLDIINGTGHYLWTSGFSLGHTAGQHALDAYNIDREEAYDIPDSSTSMMGLKLSNPDSKIFLDSWLEGAQTGLFHGKRDQITAHQDITKRVQMFEHRQDQTVASILAHKLEMSYNEPGEYSQYANEPGEYPDSVVLVMRGGL